MTTERMGFGTFNDKIMSSLALIAIISVFGGFAMLSEKMDEGDDEGAKREREILAQISSFSADVAREVAALQQATSILDLRLTAAVQQAQLRTADRYTAQQAAAEERRRDDQYERSERVDARQDASIQEVEDDIEKIQEGMIQLNMPDQ